MKTHQQSRNKSESSNRKFNENRLCQKYGNTIIIILPYNKHRIVIGRHWPGVLFTIGVIIGGSMMNMRIVSRSGTLSDVDREFYAVFIIVMCLIVLVLLLLTATGDPGIVFANPFSVNDSEDDTSESEHFNLQDTPYCSVCNVYQVQRMKIHHCEDCNYCIEGMDHHCPWMGQCVGKKNMRWFLLFNTSWVILFVEFLYVAFTSGPKK